MLEEFVINFVEVLISAS